jgi:hypothetical protein
MVAINCAETTTMEEKKIYNIHETIEHLPQFHINVSLSDHCFEHVQFRFIIFLLSFWWLKKGGKFILFKSNANNFRFILMLHK